MYKIEYEIKLNDLGRPYIDLPKSYEDKMEDKFMVIELATYVIRNSFNNQKHTLDETSRRLMGESLDFLLDIGDSMAEIMLNSMKASGEIAMMINNGYHIIVNSIEERDALPNQNIQYLDKLFNRVEGLIVLVNNYDLIDLKPFHTKYKLMNGITNEHWIEVE